MPLYTRDRNGTVQAAADQIVWAGDTNLYRSAADTLRTDDSLVVGAILTVLGAASFAGAVTGLTKTTVGLPAVDNTADSAKPVSTAAQAALDLKAPLASPTFTGTVSGLTKATVGLPNVDNTTDAAKPVSTAAQTAFDLKAPLASPTFTGTVAGLTKTTVGLPNVDNTADAAKPVSTAQATADLLRVLKTGDTMTGALALLASVDAGYPLTVTNTDATGGAISVYLAASNRTALRVAVSSEAALRFYLTSAGGMNWGDGTLAVDTTLYRLAAASLKTDGALTVAGNLTAPKILLGTTGQIYVSGSTAYFRNAADSGYIGIDVQDLSVRGTFSLSSSINIIRAAPGTANAINTSAVGDTQNRWMVDASGKMTWGSGAAVQDTTLFRNAAAELKTDGNFEAGYNIYARHSQAAQVKVGEVTAGYVAGLTFGNAEDTNLYRSAADTLKTDDTLAVGGQVLLASAGGSIGTTTVGVPQRSNVFLFSRVAGESQHQFYVQHDGMLVWGSGAVAGDTRLYRTGVATLKTDGKLDVAGLLALAAGAAGVGGLTIGGDTNLYRAAAGILATTSRFAVAVNSTLPAVDIVNSHASGVGITALLGGAGCHGYRTYVTGDTQFRFVAEASGKMLWGSGAALGDTNLYRSAAGVLKTDGALIVVGDTFTNGLAATSAVTVTRAIYLETHRAMVTGDTQARISLTSDGQIRWGSGSATADTGMSRQSANVVQTDGAFVAAGVIKPGRFTTALRPTAASAGVGGNIYDTTLSRPIWSDGVVWRDAAGAAV